ncbi:MAG TPA: hypothetical protein VGK94_12785 [Candidatus Polarisedimenticolia bacterium]|jgi:hypothetical protein
MSRKEKREERLIKGDEALEARGLDLDAPDEELLPALIAARGEDPDADLSIADLMGSIAMEEAARHLVEWDKASPPDKDLTRMIRKSLFRLQQRGIAAAVREVPPVEPVRIFDPVEPAGYLSPMDGWGNRLTWLTRPRPEGGLVVLTSLIGDVTGMREVHEFFANKGQLKEIFADAAHHSAQPAAAPHRYVDWLMWDAYRRGVPRDEQGGGYPLLRADFYTEVPSPVASPVHELIGAAGATDDERLLDESAQLFSEKEFSGWALPDDLVKLHQARFRDAQDSTLVLSKEAMTERLTGVIDKAFDEIFVGEGRALYATRLQEMALWYLLAARDARDRSRALTCYALHRALADSQRRLKEVSFLRALAFRSFLHLLPREGAEQEGPEPTAPSLIVRPD